MAMAVGALVVEDLVVDVIANVELLVLDVIANVELLVLVGLG